MKHALIYTRVSTEEQAEDGRHSLAAQRTICLRAASEFGHKIIETFEDPGKSGTTMQRPGLQDLLIRCQEDPTIDAVYVQDSDRLARNTHDHLTIKALLAKRGVRVVSASQPMIGESAEGQMIDTIIASVNQFQSDLTARKTLKGLQEKVRGGGWPGQAPLGYRNMGTGEEGKERIIIPDPSTAPLIQQLFVLYATGRYSVASLGDYLYQKGLRSRHGRKLQQSKVHAILQNRFYIGDVHWGGIRAKGKHKAIVDPDLFRSVNNMLAQKRHFASRARRHTFLLRGLIRCAKCGGLYVAETHLRKRKAYYRCHKRGGCDRCLESSRAEEQVAAHVGRLSFSDGFIAAILSRLRKQFSTHRAQLEANKRTLINQQTALTEKREAAEDKLLRGVLSDEDFRRIRREIQTALDQIEDQLGAVGRQRKLRIDVVEDVLGLVRSVSKTYERASQELKRVYLGLLWDRFMVRQGRIVAARPTRLLSTLLVSCDAFLAPHRSDPEPQNPPEKERVLFQRFGGAPVLVTGDASGKAHKPVRDGRAYVPGGDHHPIRLLSTETSVRLRSGWGPNHHVVRPIMELLQDLPYLQGLIAQLQEIRRLEKTEGLERDSTRFAQANSCKKPGPAGPRRG